MRRGWVGLVDRATGRGRPGRAGRTEAGDTLIEVLFAIIILGIASVALLVAFAASISASAVHRSIATFDTVIRSASQQAISQIQQQPDPLYESCAPLAYYQTGPGEVMFTLPTGYSAQVTGVQYWTGSVFSPNVSQCVPNSPQWITITITSSSGQSYTNNFIVDDPYAPPVPVGGPAYQLVFVQQPSGADAGVAFGSQPAIAVEDSSGHVVTTDLSPVTLTITTGTGTSGAALSQYCTGVENSGVVSFSGCSINLAGLNYQLTASDPGSGGGALVPAISTPFSVYTQLTQPVITSLIPSTTEAGAVNVTFTGSSNAPGGESYTVTACANSGVGFGCVTENNFTSGSDLTGLTPGTSYYVTVTANAPTPLYLPATSATAGPAQATVQLNAPGTPTLAYGTVAGSLQVTFTTPTPASPTQTYLATACTNASMTTGCVTGPVSPGGNLTGLAYSAGSPGTTYYVTVTAAASSGYLVSSPSGVSSSQAVVSQVNPPTGFSSASSTTQPGAVSVTFAASAGPQLPASYTASICTNAAMTQGCTSQTVNPGTTQLTGLTPGTVYYVQVLANPPSAGYLGASTSVAPGVPATTALASPTGVALAYGTVAGSINVSFTAPANAAAGQAYTATGCTNAGMSSGCVSNTNISSGGNLTGLSYTSGSPGTTYYVTVTSNASSGYFASPPTSPLAQAETSKLNAPGTPTAVTSTSVAGAIVITYSTPGGTAPASYTATACTNNSMTTGCLTGSITSGGTLNGLNQGSSYWVTVTANPPAGYVGATSPVSTNPTGASTQLNLPTITGVLPSTTTAGQLTIAYTGSSNAPGGQTYTATACTDAAMTQNCVSHASYVSNSQFTGLTAGTLYYVTITAVSSANYLAATTAPVGPTLATVQLVTPATPTLGYGSVAGSISVTATTSNGPVGQLYTVKACTNAGMTTGCVTTANVVSGGNATGLAYTQGSPGSAYYATVTAQASTGYLGSGTSGVAGPQADTSLLNAPGTPTTAPSTTTAGAVTATFSNSSGPTVAGYSATACTNNTMTAGCVTQAGYTSGAQLTGLVQGTKYYVTITAVSSSAAYAASTSSVSNPSVLATVQLATPTITSVAPSTTNAGQLTISYAGSSNAPGGQTYTAMACTNAGMTTGCVTQTNYTSGAQLTGLTAGTAYYVTITATASSGYLSVTTTSVGPTMATVQLATPSTPTLAYGSVAGSIAVTASSSNAPVGQLFTVKACTNNTMTSGCVTTTSVLSGGNATGLLYTPGAAGTAYYVTVVAQASSGYLASGTSGVAGPQNATSQLAQPTGLTTAPSTTTSGAITATYTASTGAVPASYTATVCTNAAMTANCTTFPNETSGAQLTGLTPATSYYTTITAVSGSAAYVSATTVASGPTLATTQLNAPTGVSLAYGTVAGSIAVTYTNSSNAPGGQTYTVTACTNAGMSTGCVTNANLASGANLTGLAYVQGAAGTAYYVTVTANASSGYLPSPASAAAGPQNATSQLGTPGTPTVASSTTVAGAITATFTSSTGTAPQSYTVMTCTNAAMTTGCLTQANYVSGAQIFPLTEGQSYYATITAVPPSTAYVASTSGVSSGSAVASTQLTTPTITNVAPSTTTAGAITIAFTGSTNAPGGQVYVATACTDVAMTQNCESNPGYVSGSQLTGLGAGEAYYVEITAGASSGYLAATSPVQGPVLATVQLSTPTTPVLAYGATAGAINVSTSSANAPSGQTYTVKACTNAGMSTGCVTSAPITSGTDVGSLAYTPGQPGTNYYVTVIAVASSGYLQSPSSAVAGPQADTSQLTAPGTPVVAPSTTTVGAVTATFAASSGVAPGSYTATVCTNAAMTANCTTFPNDTSGGQLTGLTPGTSYYVQIAAIPGSAAYTAATSGVSASSAPATTQLNAPTGVSLAYGTVAGSIAVTYTNSSNAAGGQTYTVTACTNAGMSTGCVTNANLASGANLTGLAYVQGSAGTAYYVTVTANASTGYLASAPSTTAGPQNATSQIGTPGTPTVASSTTTAGAITATFTASAGTSPTSYTAKACTNAGMTTGCVTQAGYTSGAQLTGLAQGSSYFVTITAVPPTGYTSATSAVSASSAAASTQLATPTITSVAPSTTTPGAVTINFTGSSNAPGGQTYTATACTNAGMSTGCVTQAGYTTGAQFSGLTAGTSYWVTITAVASAGWLPVTTASTGPTLASVQLNAPTGVSLAYGTVAGSIAVTYTNSSNAAGGQTYTVKACTNAGMSTGCVTNANLASGANLTGLAYVQGAAGTAYYVTVAANASTGYLASAASTTAGPQNATSQVSAPGTPTLAASSTTAGAITATFTASSGTAPASYTAVACTNAAMTAGCVTQTNYTSGAQLTGLAQGTSYYVQITAVPPTGYTAATSGVSASSAPATTQLNAPTGVSLAYGTVAGSIAVTYTNSSNAAGGQTYTVTACTNAGMSTGCVTNANLASGANLTGLAYVQGSAGTAYYVTVTANASTGYLASAPSTTAGPQNATSQIGTPGTPTVASSTTTAGAITATFTASAGTSPTSYTAKACTNAGMTTGCVTQAGYTSGAQLTGLAQGSSYFVTITAVPPTGYTSATSAVSASSAAASTQLATPTITSVAPSTTTPGAVTINFTGSSNAPGGQTYTATACTNAGMSTGCVTQAGYTTGAQFSGLTAGTSYWVTITAVASAGWLPVTTASTGPTLASVQLNAPTGVSLAYGTVAGSIAVTYTNSSNAAGGQTYTVKACTNAGMSTGCVTNANLASGANLTGLAYVQGAAGTAYYVTVAANASTGYLASAASTTAGPQNATSQVSAPGTPTLAASSTTAGAITATFTASSGTAPASYTAVACTNAAMTAGCVTQTNYTSGAQLTGLAQGTSYYVQITAVPPTGYTAATSGVSASSAPATTQLNAPTGVSLAYGTVAGSIAVTYTNSSNAAGGQTYTVTACTNAGMSTGCVTNANLASGANLTGLAYVQGSAGTAYYVTVTANASTGYLASAPSTTAGPQNATSQVNPPGTPVVSSSTTTAGAVTATFSAPSGVAPASYTAVACTNAAMTAGCVTQAGYTSGAQLTGLTQGTGYYVQVTANGAAGYTSATSAVSASPGTATIALATPSTPVLGYGAIAGSITVTSTSSNAPGGETYTVTACTNAGMTNGCVTNGSFTSGSTLSGLAYTQGSVGTSYYVTATANATAGYVASAASAVGGPHADTSQVNAPGTPTVAASTTTAGAVTATFTASSGVAPASYTAVACTNAAMTAGCVTQTSYTSGAQLTGLTQGTSYYVEVTAVPPTGYVSATSAVSASPAAATTQLATSTITGVTSSTTTAGQLIVTFTGAANAPGGQLYTAVACTNAAMTAGCVTQTSYTSGAQLTSLSPGTSYYVTITAVASTGYLASTTGAFGPTLATVQLTTPTINTVAPSTTTAGALTITYTGSTNAPGGQTYNATACTNVAMTTGCVTQTNYTSGAQLTGLTAGTNYYVTLTANASSGYLPVTTSSVGPTLATVQLTSPTGVSLAYGTVAGSIAVTFAGSSNAPGGQTYTATACTNNTMTTGCVTGAITSGGNLTGLAYSPGAAGTAYYVTVTATASSGYLASAPSSVFGPQAATSQLNAPTGLATAPSTTTAGAITATFTGSSGVAPASYTATACTNAAMTTGCVPKANYVSGAQLTGLTAGTNYYVEVTAVAPSGFVSATSAVSSATLATVQLTAPTGVSLGYGTVAGSVAVTFTGSSNAPGGQTYTATACTNNTMTTGCVTGAITSGGNLTGLPYTQGAVGTSYYVTVTAAASSGYLVSTASSVAGPHAETSQLNAPTGLTTAPSTTTAGALTATFTASTGTAPTSYTATACTNAAMTTGCVTQTNYTSGAQLTGLTAGTNYYVTITAVPPAGYVSATTAASAATLATVQLTAPTAVTLNYGTVAGSVAVTFTAPGNAAGGQAYTATACTNAAMTTGCVSGAITSGGNLTGLAYTLGSAGTTYWATVTATASSGYLVSPASAVSASHADTSQVNAPTAVTAATGNGHGRLQVTFTASAGQAPASYTAMACTNVGMTTGCVTQTFFTSGSQLTGLANGTGYFVTVTATSSTTAFLPNTSTPPASGTSS